MEAPKKKIDLDDLWKKSLVRVTDEFSLPPVILQVDDAVIGTLGNFSATTGKAKAKKTFNVSAIVASALINGQVLEYRASLPEGKRKILYFDTEQSPYHCKKVLQRILKLAGLPLDRQPENLIFSHLREIANPAVRCEIIRKAIYGIEGIGLVVIDGIRDLMLDINNATQATTLIGDLMQWTSERKIHIQTVLHLNKGDDNSRGHIGTELNNKAETVLQVTKDPTDENRSIVSASFIRSKPFDKFAFRITDEPDNINIPQLDTDFHSETLTKRNTFGYTELSDEEHRQALELTFENSDGLGYGDVIEALRKNYATVIGATYGIGKTKQLLTFLRNKRMIVKNDKLYTFNPEYYY
ncbi:MAG: AAA family ATPase [Paludibacter sp.]|nr:AAA family ATPase [Paludibacter sp.]